MKLNSIKKIQFWGLRNSLGAGGGVIFDCDTKVTWLCRVVRVVDGLKWQIVRNNNQWDSCMIEYDQECLDNTPLHDVKIVHEPMVKYSLIGQRGKALDKVNLCDIPF